ncbi:putative rubredoxin, iron-binding protein [Dioscorea sansibarensis]
MASSSSFTTSRPTFPFPHLPLLHPTTKPFKACSFPALSVKKPHLLSFRPTIISSVDVSKEDKPLSEPESLDKEEEKEKEKEKEKEEQSSNLDPRRFEEKFAVLNTGIYECRSCGYRYDEAAGDPSYPIPPGFQFGKLPEDWRCPTCGAAKSFFESKSIEIAGFAQNQQFGIGANTLTSGQKAFLIYGGLLLGFIFFLSGYFLQ